MLRPNRDAVSTIREDGSKVILHPADVRGRHTSARRVVAAFLLLIYLSLPWIPIRGFPAVFFDIIERRFHFFGFTLAAQDLWLAFFLVTGLAFSLYAVSAILGRIWCGWACPYTVFLEHVYRRVERWIDGDSVNRRRLDQAPWSVEKIFKRLVKHFAYLLISVVVANIFLSYFFSLPKLWGMMKASPLEHWGAFSTMLFLTGAMYFAFSWFREQFCIILCPYGRLQSVLTDDHTMVVGYDAKRGEPRGKKRANGAAIGDCVDCLRCVQVCPTGIDIRQGLQMECIGCAACVDACSEVMTKLKRPTGLIRHDSLEGLKGNKTKWLRPRTWVYGVLLLIGFSVMSYSLSRIQLVHVKALRLAGASFYENESTIRNQFQVRFSSSSHKEMIFRVELDGLPEAAYLVGPDAKGEVVAPAMREEVRTFLVEIPKDKFEGEQKFVVNFYRQGESKIYTQLHFTFLGPNLWNLEK